MEPIISKIDFWNIILDQIEQRLNKHIFDTWFKKIDPIDIDENARIISLQANLITKDWITDYYSELLQQCIKAAGYDGYSVKWLITASDETDDRFESNGIEEEKFDNNSQERIIPESPLIIQTANFVDIEPVENSLNPKYTFEKFVVGSSNQFAHAAAIGAAQTPGKTYNPLFIYGGTGLGKTHLMHAIGHSIKQNNRHVRVSYVTSEKFMNELISAIRFDKTQSFREKYRSIDVLLIDDVQFFAGKERTQEEFFHTFNALHNSQKQIVITSDCPPRNIPTLEERLHSRFEWGLIADIEPPDLETKVAILKRKADLDGIDLPDDIAIYIAEKIKSNVRELEGSLVRLVAIASLKGLPISKMLAQDALKTILDAERSEGLTMERIIKAVAAKYDLSVDLLKSKSNSRAISFPRQVAMYICKRLTKHSFPEIGREFGGKHHTTVMHSVEKIEKLTKEDRVFHNTISELIDSVSS